MRTVTIITLLIVMSSTGRAQWHKIADFGGQQEYITCVYFLDLPGPPRIGFVGTGTNLHKTTNGGNSWTKVWGKGYYSLYYVTDICFKDSLTGWFTVVGDTDACYRTTDGGNTWDEIYSSPNGSDCIYYSKSTRVLFLGLVSDVDNGTVLSKNLGNTWFPPIDTPGGDIVSLSDSIAIGSGSENSLCDTCNLPDTNYGIFRTTDGGMTWSYIHIHAPAQSFGFEPLAFVGSPVCFLCTFAETSIWRSDDLGVTWRKIADFGPLVDSNGKTHPYCTGYIKGDLTRLSIQTDSGMYVSTDSGVTWRNDGGPTYLTNFSNDNFYSAKGVTIAGMTYGAYGGAVDAGGGLWEETWPQAGLTPSAAPAGPEVCVYPNPTPGLVTIRGAVGVVTVMNVLGESVMRQASRVMRNGDLELDLSGLPAGIYYARVRTAGGVQSVKVVKE